MPKRITPWAWARDFVLMACMLAVYLGIIYVLKDRVVLLFVCLFGYSLVYYKMDQWLIRLRRSQSDPSIFRAGEPNGWFWSGKILRTPPDGKLNGLPVTTVAFFKFHFSSKTARVKK